MLVCLLHHSCLFIFSAFIVDIIWLLPTKLTLCLLCSNIQDCYIVVFTVILVYFPSPSQRPPSVPKHLSTNGIVPVNPKGRYRTLWEIPGPEFKVYHKTQFSILLLAMLWDKFIICLRSLSY